MPPTARMPQRARRRPSSFLRQLGIAVALVTIAALAGFVFPATGSAGASASRALVNATFVVKDGDTNAPLTGVAVVFTDAAGTQLGRGTSDGSGLVTLAGVESGTQLVATATAPAAYTAFPVSAAASDAAQTPLPLYRAKSQWTTWGMTNDRLHVGPALGLPVGDPLWTFDAGNMLEFPPCVAYGMVISGSYHGFISFHRTDGTLVKRIYTSSKFANQSAITDWVEGSGGAARRVARVYFADLKGKIWCLDAFTGAEVWTSMAGTAGGQTRIFKSFEASPLVVGERLYLATRYNKNGGKAGLWALDRRTGAVLWYRQLGIKPDSKIAASPTYGNGKVFVATYDGIVYALDPAKGKVLWKSKLGGSLYSTPTVSGTRLFIGNKTTKVLSCLATKNGKLLWKTKLGNPVYSSPAVWGGKVYVGSGKRIFALKSGSGKVAWKRSTVGKVLGSGTVLRDAVYFSDFSGVTHGYDARTGKTVWKFDDGRYSPITAAGGLIVLSGRRTLYAFAPGP
jgi:outer membrane protein assembly factor BamB